LVVDVIEVLVNAMHSGRSGSERILKQITQMGMSITEIPGRAPGNRPECIKFSKT